MNKTPDDVVKFSDIQNTCMSCHAINYCFSTGLNDNELAMFDGAVKRQQPLQRGDSLYFAGNQFQSIYIVHSGSVKTYIESGDGEQQITGFHFPGDLTGTDGMENGKHTCTVEALETSSFCELYFHKFEDISQHIPMLKQQLARCMSSEINHERKMLLQLGKMNAERRLAHFLMDISARMQAHGFSRHSINLSMTRHDIANYLGLAIETVRRLLTRFQVLGVLKVERRCITIKDRQKLQGISDNTRTDFVHMDGSILKQRA